MVSHTKLARNFPDVGWKIKYPTPLNVIGISSKWEKRVSANPEQRLENDDE
jgi:hypothetical protein